MLIIMFNSSDKKMELSTMHVGLTSEMSKSQNFFPMSNSTVDINTTMCMGTTHHITQLSMCSLVPSTKSFSDKRNKSISNSLTRRIVFLDLLDRDSSSCTKSNILSIIDINRTTWICNRYVITSLLTCRGNITKDGGSLIESPFLDV